MRKANKNGKRPASHKYEGGLFVQVPSGFVMLHKQTGPSAVNVQVKLTRFAIDKWGGNVAEDLLASGELLIVVSEPDGTVADKILGKEQW